MLRVLQYLMVFMSVGLKLVTAVLVISLKIIPEICDQQTSVERDCSELIFVMIVIGLPLIMSQWIIDPLGPGLKISQHLDLAGHR